MKIPLSELFKNRKLDEILSGYSVEEVIKELDFKDAIKLAWRMLFDDYSNYEQSEFGVNLLFALKEHNPSLWNSDWRYDALLGIACGSHYKYDERYEAFKRAYDKAEKIEGDYHPGLLISLASCHDAPGPPRISEDDAIDLVKRAMEQKIYLDGAWELSSLYHTKGDMENHKKWKEIALNLGKEAESPHFYPQFLWDEEISPKE